MNIGKQEIDLLYGETILSLIAEQDVDSFEVSYAAPICYKDQVPLILEIEKISSLKILEYKIQDDKHKPNKIIRFKFPPLKKNEKVHIHFKYYVIVKNRDYENLPKKIEVTKIEELSEEVKRWLLPSKSIQSNNIFIRCKAKILGLSKNFLDIGKKISISICFHRPLLRTIRRFIELNPILCNFFFGNRYWTGLSDAVSGYLFGGHCAAQNNLGIAYFRANNIPSRGLIVTPMFYNKKYFESKGWLDAQHYTLESYTKEYGWINGGPGGFPINTNHGIVLRINTLEDEDIAGNGLSYYGGIQPWFWISNKDISLTSPGILFGNKKFRKSGEIYIRGWLEKNLEINNVMSNRILSILKKNWILYTKYFGKNLDYEDNKYFLNAVRFQNKAIENFKKSKIKNFVENIENAYFLLSKIKK